MSKRNQYTLHRVMIIDDNPIEHFIIERVLDTHYFAQQIIRFLKAQDALDYLQRNADCPDELPQLIFLDINMDGINGYQFLKIFENLSSKVKGHCRIVIISSSVMQEDKAACQIFSSVISFIEKPLTGEKLRPLPGGLDSLSTGQEK